MNIFEHYPLLRPFSAYACGICIAYFGWEFRPFSSKSLQIAVLALFLSVALLWLMHCLACYRTRKIFVFWLLPLYVGLGSCSVFVLLPSESEISEFGKDESFRIYRGRVVEPPAFRPQTVRLTLQMEAAAVEEQFFPMEEKCMLSLERNAAAEQLAYGDVLLFKARLRTPGPPLNEAAFDYRKFLARKGIYLRAYSVSGQWLLCKSGVGNPLMLLTSRWRGRLVELLGSGALDEVSKGIVATMLLGDDSFLDPEVSGMYSSVGVSHILCVSGMHVGIIYMLFDYLLFFLNRNRLQRILKMLLLVAVVWLYACMAALSPSVVRSAVMFSFVSIGKLFRQQTQTYNSLLASAFLMLLLKPMLLFEVGFQLSYLAVWGIVCIQPILQRFWQARCRLLAYLWGIWSVSIAAQLFTSPISIYCFHQFPTYFLLSNIVVVSLAPFVIGLGMAYLLCSFSVPISTVVAGILDVIIRIMQAGVAIVAAIPGSSITDIYLSPLQLVLLYITLLFMLALLVKKRMSVLLAALGCFCVVAADGLVHAWRNHERQEVRLYAMAHHAAVETGSGKNSIFFTEAPADYAEGAFDFSVRGCQLKNGCTHPLLLCADTLTACWVKDAAYFQAASLSFWMPQGFIRRDECRFPENFPDYLLVGDSLKSPAARVLEQLHPSTVCLLQGLPAYRRKQWKAACEAAGISVLDMGESGMLKIGLENQKNRCGK